MILWTVGITRAEFDLLMQGKTLEKLIEPHRMSVHGYQGESGLLVIEQDSEGTLRLRFLTTEEAGLRF